MANALSPTAANILSSLGVRGATADERLPGYIPVLGADGRLSASFIPASAAQEALPALSNVAYVDPYTEVPAGSRKGSVAAPFQSLPEAAARFEPSKMAGAARYMAFVLAPGKYENDFGMEFPVGHAPLSVYLIATGECVFPSSTTTFTISGMAEATGDRTPTVWLQGLRTPGEIKIVSSAEITVLGGSRIGSLSASDGAVLRIAPDSRVDSTSVETVFMLDSASVGNTSAVTGRSVGDALDRLGGRRIRVAKVSVDSSGFDVGSSYEDLSAGSQGSGVDVYDLRSRDRMFVEGINRFIRTGKDVVADTVTAGTVVADVVRTGDLQMDSLVLGGYRLEVDAYGYLSVMDGSEHPPRPPSNAKLIRDSETGALYLIGVASGRLYVEPFSGSSDSSDSSSSYSDSSDSSSSYSGVPYSIEILDDIDGGRYDLTMENGRIVISPAED